MLSERRPNYKKRSTDLKVCVCVCVFVFVCVYIYIYILVPVAEVFSTRGWFGGKILHRFFRKKSHSLCGGLSCANVT